MEQAALWCRWHQFLSRAGYPFDLVLLLEEGGDYRRPLRSALTEELKKLGAESVLGARGGIHLANPDAAPVVLAWAKAVLPVEDGALDGPFKSEIITPPAPVNLSPDPALWIHGDRKSVV